METSSMYSCGGGGGDEYVKCAMVMGVFQKGDTFIAMEV